MGSGIAGRFESVHPTLEPAPVIRLGANTTPVESKATEEGLTQQAPDSSGPEVIPFPPRKKFERAPSAAREVPSRPAKLAALGEPSLTEGPQAPAVLPLVCLLNQRKRHYLTSADHPTVNTQAPTLGTPPQAAETHTGDANKCHHCESGNCRFCRFKNTDEWSWITGSWALRQSAKLTADMNRWEIDQYKAQMAKFVTRNFREDVGEERWREVEATVKELLRQIDLRESWGRRLDGIFRKKALEDTNRARREREREIASLAAHLEVMGR